ncbi:putative delta-60 repeat protein [Pseudomonas sp. WPR_5_2]|uniref:hypothetical protein n=1 Tax=Pseudomonas sp. WPR_5_2 TaxID=1907371 RepID=UPI000F28075F|nr:hypothetical protein [Pseudomonas sp. WPR_5_2]RKS16435.1 putative delta-60 repeat protein [Pseudomonas sp. WPR_5_2]
MNTTNETAGNDSPFLDPTFGQQGKISHSFPGTRTSQVAGVAVNKSGKIVVSATTYSDDGRQFGLFQMNENGSIDTRFGRDGYVRDNFLPSVDALGGPISIFDDNKILLSGFNHTEEGGYQPVLLRVNENGERDISFGDRGHVIVNIPSTEPQLRSLQGSDTSSSNSMSSTTVQPDGTILLTVHSSVKGQDGYGIIMRFLQSGAPDTSFGNSGYVKFKAGGDSVKLSGHLVQVDGKIIVFGGVQKEHEHGLIVRFNRDGSPDKTFGAGGFSSFSYRDHSTHINQVILAPNGRLVAAGFVYTYKDVGLGTNDCMVMGFTKDGQYDTTFNFGKPAISQPRPQNCLWLGGTSLINHITMTIGNVIAQPENGEKNEFLVGSYLGNGSLDPGFADGVGWKTIPVFGDSDGAVAFALMPDNKLLIAGNSWRFTSYQTSFVRLASY